MCTPQGFPVAIDATPAARLQCVCESVTGLLRRALQIAPHVSESRSSLKTTCIPPAHPLCIKAEFYLEGKESAFNPHISLNCELHPTSKATDNTTDSIATTLRSIKPTSTVIVDF